MTDLQGKTAIITGASSGIGRATAKLFAGKGAITILMARREDALKTLAEDIASAGGMAIISTGDVTREDDCARAVGIAMERYGRLDIAFNNAGIVGSGALLQDTPMEEWQQTIAVNLTGAYLCAKHQLPAMLETGDGSMIFTSSFVGNSCALQGMGAYGASKAGLVGLMKGLAAENGKTGIRVNAILPGGVDTELNPLRKEETPPEVADFINGLHAMGRIARPGEIAEAALFLASDRSSFMTGTAMTVDGGVSVYRR